MPPYWSQGDTKALCDSGTLGRSSYTKLPIIYFCLTPSRAQRPLPAPLGDCNFSRLDPGHGLGALSKVATKPHLHAFAMHCLFTFPSLSLYSCVFVAMDDGSLRLLSLPDILSDLPFSRSTVGSGSGSGSTSASSSLKGIHSLMCRQLPLWDACLSPQTSQ